MNKSQFRSPLYPYLLLIPQLSIIVIFFYWPAAEAIRSSFFLEDPFGFSSTFVGLDNYHDMCRDPTMCERQSSRCCFRCS